MPKNLVIVESPAKAKTIEKFLGDDFIVTSCYGHIRNLDKKNNGVEIENNFEPNYIIPDEKKKVVSDLKQYVKKAEMVWLASDEDREGEAIAWHLKEVLKLKKENTKRIVFNEITEKAIKTAVDNPREIDENLFEAQQARRILDRLVGFELSPVLWKKVKPSLSAGRVQSVAVRLVVEREREIDSFKPESKFRVTAHFLTELENGELVKAELNTRFSTEKEATEFLGKCKLAEFSIDSVEKKPVKKFPTPPFTTSTLQQEAARKLRFSVKKTMLVAQKLYEAGKITYMRTDSVNLSELAINAAKSEIVEMFGAKYSQPRKYQTKSKNAQEAHEAIRPTYLNKQTISGSYDEKALYELIWKRTVASQMTDAEIEKTIVKIKMNNVSNYFAAKGEVIIFDGFLKLYIDSTDDESDEKEEILPPLMKNQNLFLNEAYAIERYTRPPARYTEASLVKKFEELGIGRPSTYAPTISTIQKRGYVENEERAGKERKYVHLHLKKNNISKKIETEIYGADKGKLFPTDIALLVNDFLTKYFPNILDFTFTAKIEEQFDEIANGKINWSNMLKEFYIPFHKNVEETTENSERVSGEKILGFDKTGKQVSVRMAKYGPVAQLKNLQNEEEKLVFASLINGQKLETISLDEALSLFDFPREVGIFEKEKMTIAVGRFGPYIKHQSKFYSIPKNYDPLTISENEAVSVIELKRISDSQKVVKIFPEDENIQILNGRWGVYLKVGKDNYKIPKSVEKPENLTFDEIKQIISQPVTKKKK